MSEVDYVMCECINEFALAIAGFPQAAWVLLDMAMSRASLIADPGENAEATQRVTDARVAVRQTVFDRAAKRLETANV